MLPCLIHHVWHLAHQEALPQNDLSDELPQFGRLGYAEPLTHLPGGVKVLTLGAVDETG